MDRLPELEHHVVRDVDEHRERADAGELQPRDHPRRGGASRVDVAHDARGEHGRADAAADGRLVADLDGEAVARGIHGCGLLDRVAEPRAGGVGVLAGHAADRERVAAVGRDVDLDGGVVQAEQRDRVGADGRVDAERREAQDALVVVAEAELAGGGDHAVGHVPVGRAGRDRERAGQHGAGQRHHDLVADEEVAGAADDAVHGVAAVGGRLAVGRDAHPAPPDGLAVGLRLLDELEHLAHDDRALELERVHVLLFEADPHEGGVHVFRSRARDEFDVLGEPAERHSHGSDHHSERSNGRPSGQRIQPWVRPPFRTAGRTGRLPRPSRACPARRCAA